MPRVRVTEKMRYLGIVVSSDPYQYIEDNLAPLLEKFKRKSDIWGKLPLSMAGRANLIQMVWMPQLLYVLHNSPVWIGKKWFLKINTLFRELIWRKGQARISLQTLQRPTREGGLAVPQPYNYFLAAQLQHIGGCETQDWRDPSGKIMLQDSLHKSLIEALEAGSLQDGPPTCRLVNKVWQTTKWIMGYRGFTEFLPIWQNKFLRELMALGKSRPWEHHGISRLAQLYDDKKMLKSFTELRSEYGIPKTTFYCYLQVRHALGSQFKNCPPVWCKIPFLESIVRTNSTKGLVTKIYEQLSEKLLAPQMTMGVRARWEADVGEITDYQWKKILEFGPLVSVSPSQQASHLLLLHRAYYTPKRLHKFGNRQDDKCPRCLDTGDLIHMMWRCPKLARYWGVIVKIIEARWKISLAMEAKVCILGLTGENIGSNDIRIAVGRCLYQARKLIAQAWLSATPPTPEEWTEVMNKLVWMEKTTYIRRGSYGEFVKIWRPWLAWMGVSF